MKVLQRGQKKALAIALSVAMGVSCFGGFLGNSTEMQAAKKTVLKTKKVTLQVGKKKKISISGKKKKASYTFKASKSIIKVSKTGVITAKRAGKAKVTVKEIYKKETKKIGTVNVQVKNKIETEKKQPVSTSSASGPSSAPQVTQKPDATPGVTPGTTPDATPGTTPTASPIVTPDTTPETTPEPTDQTVYSNFFEDGETKGLTARGSGDATLAISKAANHTEGGQQCLEVTGRTKEWNGIQLDISKLVETGSTYQFSAWVRQDGEQKENIGMKFQYKDLDGNDKYIPATSDDKDVEAAPGEWVHLYGEKKIPDYEGTLYLYFEVPSSTTVDFKLDDVEIVGKPVSQNAFKITDEIYAEMKENGVLSTGNNARIKSTIEKARAGEDVTLAYIGGSITEGALASPNAKCYAQVSATAFAEKYGKDDGSNVHFVNAGMSGTPSSLGIVRYDRDVLGQMTTGDHPDILFIEFAVNDYGECTNGGAYEGLIRRALKSGSAVVLVFSIFQSGRVLESTYKKYGEAYDLPMISMGDSIEKYFKEEDFFSWYFGDTLHPNNTGYQLMSDCIMNMMDKIDKEVAEADNIDSANLPAAKTSDAYTNIKMIDPTTDISAIDAISDLSMGGFNQKDGNTGVFQYPYKGLAKQAWFPENWMHTSTSGNDSFKATVNCKTLMIVYKLSSDVNTGSVDLYVDGVKKKTISGYSASGWNNATPEVLFTDTVSKTHSIELKMATGSEAKEFTLIGFGYSE